MGLNKWVAPQPFFHRTSVTSVALRNADGVGNERTETTEDNVVRQLRFNTKVRPAVLILLTAGFFAGCGGGSSSSNMTPSNQPSVENAIVAGQYNLVLTSGGGHNTTNIYANFTQNGAAFTGGANTLVCPSNDPSQCIQNSVTSNGTVNGTNVTIVVSYPGQSGTTTVNMAGSATAAGPLSGNYTDNLGDAGTWTATTAATVVSNTVISYTGTFNSTTSPLSIPPSITVELELAISSVNLTGTASVTNSPCITSLTLSGQEIGNAFSLTDAVNKVDIIAVPSQLGGSSFNFSYKFESTAPSCSGNYGTGVLTTNSSPWDY